MNDFNHRWKTQPTWLPQQIEEDRARYWFGCGMGHVTQADLVSAWVDEGNAFYKQLAAKEIEIASWRTQNMTDQTLLGKLEAQVVTLTRQVAELQRQP